MTSTPSPPFRRTRLAPTPSGFLHLGNLYSFLLTSALARRHGAAVFLRIDDMDRQRAVPAYVNDVFGTLHFLNLAWSEGPVDATDFEARWSQRQRMPLYTAALETLAAAGHLFACTCSRADILQRRTDGGYPGTCKEKALPLTTPGATWRLHTPAGVKLLLQGLCGSEQITILPPSVQNVVVRKRDGDPAYQLCSVVDDLHFDVDLVVRGADLFDSTLVQLYIGSLLLPESFGQITFLHHRLLTNESGAKLSKSAGATSVHGLRNAGAAKEAVLQKVAAMAGLQGSFATTEALADGLLAAVNRQGC